MKLNCSKILVYLIILGMILPLSGLAKAEIYDVGAGSTIQWSNYLSEGDVITWDWHTTDMSEELDFWVESPTGARNSYRTDIQSWKGSFTVTSSGTWTLNWYNDNLLFDVTVECDIASYTPYTGGGDNSGGDGGSDDVSIDWMPIILLLIVVIIAIVVIAGVASSAGKKNQASVPPPPVYTQSAQQTQHQQPQQKYCSNCGRSIPPESLMCPYCGGT